MSDLTPDEARQGRRIVASSELASAPPCGHGMTIVEFTGFIGEPELLPASVRCERCGASWRITEVIPMEPSPPRRLNADGSTA